MPTAKNKFRGMAGYIGYKRQSCVIEKKYILHPNELVQGNWIQNKYQWTIKNEIDKQNETFLQLFYDALTKSYWNEYRLRGEY